MQGEWIAVEGEMGGNDVERSALRRENRRVTVKGDSFVVERVINGTAGTYKGRFEVSPKTKSFDWIGKGPGGSAVEWIGIYDLDGDTLKLCYRYNNDGMATRPKQFSTADNEKPNTTVFYTYKRDE